LTEDETCHLIDYIVVLWMRLCYRKTDINNTTDINHIIIIIIIINNNNNNLSTSFSFHLWIIHSLQYLSMFAVTFLNW